MVNQPRTIIKEALHEGAEAGKRGLGEPDVGLRFVVGVAGLETFFVVGHSAQGVELGGAEDVLRDFFDAGRGVAAVVGAAGWVWREEFSGLREGEELLGLEGKGRGVRRRAVDDFVIEIGKTVEGGIFEIDRWMSLTHPKHSSTRCRSTP